MKFNRKFIIPVVVVLVLCILGWILLKKKNTDQTTYSFVEVSRGDIENTVNATGTIEPVTTVEVGTQVSGIIDHLYVDFNDRVVRNQLMAVIDTTILSVQVRDAKANLLRSQSQYDEAKYNFERTKKLFEKNLLSELEYVTAKSNYLSAKASVQSSQNSLERAERNMRYAFIRSPINGTVIYREVEEGQTVASSFQTPRLFLIAEDLSKMEIHALVDESEIGLIKVGQVVQFEVQAYDEKIFDGTVRQVWLQPETVSNVVNYTVVIDAENPEGFLLPGMTATIDFIIEHKKDVLLVPVAVTKLQPTASMMKIMFENMRKKFSAKKDSSGGKQGFSPQGQMAGRSGGSQMGFGSGMGNMSMPKDLAFLWYFDEDKKLNSMPVKTGSTDGKNIEIIPGPVGHIEAGMKVISKIEASEEDDSNSMPRPRGFRRGPF